LRYSLWSSGRLLGHTDLDLETHQSRFIHGFIDPTTLGERILPDATGVVAVTARRPRHRAADGFDDNYLRDFRAAVNRREALGLILRDQDGDTFECDFIRVYDLRDTSYTETEPLDADELELDFEAEGEDGEDDDSETEDWAAALEEDLALRADSEMYGSTWAPPEDERWETMQYYLQVYLNVPDDDLFEEQPGYPGRSDFM
jgi:hypothetical protein